MNIQSSQQPKTLTYKAPIIRRKAIGSKPVHHFDQSSEAKKAQVNVERDPFAHGDHTVWADLPDKNTDGSPVLVDTRETVDLRPRSPWKRGGIGAAIGVVVGGSVGALVSSQMGAQVGIGIATGALAGAGLAGGIGAYSVYGEKTKLVWDKHDIVDHKMTGFRELVGPGHDGESQGFYHRYIADVDSKVIGEYQTPRVLRYKGEAPPEEPAASPVKETPAEDIPKQPGKELDVTVTYEKAKLQSRYLGSIPSDHWSYSPFSSGYTRCGPSGCNVGGQGIYRNTPVYEPNKEPRVDTRTDRIQASPYSVPLFAAGGAVAGGAAGFGLGMLFGHLTGLDTTISGIVGASALGIASSVGAGTYAAGDAVKLEWREFDIREKELVGYTEYVTPHYETRCRTTTDSDGKSTQECETVQNGWDHSFSPDVRYWSVGGYVGPKVVHYQKRDGELKPVEDKPVEESDKAKNETQKAEAGAA